MALLQYLLPAADTHLDFCSMLFLEMFNSRGFGLQRDLVLTGLKITLFRVHVLAQGART
jgi:hypothetical protein